MSLNIQKEIKRLLSFQVAALNDAKPSIGPSFVKAVHMLYRCRGKIIITGVGKSGLIAHKLASTLSSTGTPSIYLDPVEAIHGSLGIVNKKDIVLALSKSGESEEILNIIPAIKKIGAKLISLTLNKTSSMGRQSDISLTLSIKREACPHNLAPTTSSTVTLTVVDAMAIILMKMRQFGPESFALIHPGGTLGKSLLMRVSDIMRSGKDNPVVPFSATMDRLIMEISKKMDRGCLHCG